MGLLAYNQLIFLSYSQNLSKSTIKATISSSDCKSTKFLFNPSISSGRGHTREAIQVYRGDDEVEEITDFPAETSTIGPVFKPSCETYKRFRQIAYLYEYCTRSSTSIRVKPIKGTGTTTSTTSPITSTPKITVTSRNTITGKELLRLSCLRSSAF